MANLVKFFRHIFHSRAEHSKRERDLQKNDEKFKKFLELAPYAFVIANKDWRIVLVNAQTEKIFGYPRKELIGYSVEKLFPVKLHENSTTSSGFDINVLRKDGTEIPVEIRLSPFEIEDGNMVVAAIRDLTDRKRAEEKFRGLLESAPDAMVIVNKEGSIVLVNSQTESLFGYQRQEVLGKTIEILLPHCLKDKNLDQRPNFIGESRIRPIGAAGLDLWGLRKDGSKFPIGVSLSPLALEEGALITVAIRDISEQKKVQQELQAAKLSAESANRAKSDFLATMSHELRTPLNAVIGFSEVLQAQSFGSLNEKQKEYVHDIWDSGKHLLFLINDILDLSKIEAGKMELYLSEFHLPTFIEHSLTIIRERAMEHDIHLSSVIQDGIGAITADERRVKQILYNLLSNAVKFTSHGGRVGIEVSRINDREITIAVWDTGIGIEEKDREKIFKEFMSIHDDPSQNTSGTGLGLSLTKRFVELHGGKIWFESEGKDKGTRFSFTIPTVVIPQLEKEVREERFKNNRVASFKQKKQTILIVEDDPISARLLSAYLADAGYAIEFAVNGKEALAKARFFKPDLITLDIILPEKDGWDVISELKMDPATKNIPVMITSSLEEQERGFALGAVGYITKPIEKEGFEEILNKIGILNISQETNLCKVLVIDDEPTSLAIIDNVLSKKGMQVIKASGGKEGLELALKEIPNLIVLDLLMPEVTGFDVLYQLKNTPLLSRIPVVILTVKELTIPERELLFQHAKAIISKTGFNKEIFLKNVAHALSR